MIIENNDIKFKIFNPVIVGKSKKMEMINLNNKSFLLINNYKYSIETFLMSRILNYIGIDTFNNIILEQNNNLYYLIEDLISNQLAIQPAKVNKAIDLLFLKKYYAENLVYNRLIRYFLGDNDSNFINTIINYNSFKYIDLNKFKAIMHTHSLYNLYIAQFFNHKLLFEPIHFLFIHEASSIHRDELTKINKLKEFLLEYFKKHYNINNTDCFDVYTNKLLKKRFNNPNNANILIKNLTIQYINQYNEYLKTQNIDIENMNFQSFIEHIINIDKIRETINFDNIRYRINDIVKNIFLLNSRDIDYILLNHNVEKIKLNQDIIQRYIDSIISKQLELFLLYIKYNTIHEILPNYNINSLKNKIDNTEKFINRYELIISNCNNNMDGKKIAKKIDSIDNINFIISQYRATKIKEPYLISYLDNIADILKRKPNKTSIMTKYGIESHKCYIYLSIFKKEYYTVMEDVTKSFSEFQNKLKHYYNKKIIPAWNDKNFNMALYNTKYSPLNDKILHINNITINDLINNHYTQKDIDNIFYGYTFKKYEATNKQFINKDLLEVEYGIGKDNMIIEKRILNKQRINGIIETAIYIILIVFVYMKFIKKK